MRKLSAAVYTEIALSMVQIANAPDWVKALWVEHELKVRGLWRDDVFELVRPFLVTDKRANNPKAHAPFPPAPPPVESFAEESIVIEYSPAPEDAPRSSGTVPRPPLISNSEEPAEIHAAQPREAGLEALPGSDEQVEGITERSDPNDSEAEDAFAVASMMHMLAVSTRWPEESADTEDTPGSTAELPPTQAEAGETVVPEEPIAAGVPAAIEVPSSPPVRRNEKKPLQKLPVAKRRSAHKRKERSQDKKPAAAPAVAVTKPARVKEIAPGESTGSRARKVSSGAKVKATAVSQAATHGQVKSKRRTQKPVNSPEKATGKPKTARPQKTRAQDHPRKQSSVPTPPPARKPARRKKLPAQPLADTPAKQAHPEVLSPEITGAAASPRLQPVDNGSAEWKSTVSALDDAQDKAKGTQYEHIWKRAAEWSENIQRRVNKRST